MSGVRLPSFLRMKYAVAARDPRDGHVLDPPTPFRYWRRSAAESMARHLTILASCRHNNLHTAPLEYVVVALGDGGERG